MAGRKQQKKESGWSIAIVVAIVFVASLFLIVRSAPEQVFAFSQDARVQLTGVTRSSGSVEIQRLDDVEKSVRYLLSPVYEITLTSQGTIQNGELLFFFERTAEHNPTQEIVLYTFNTDTLDWESIPAFFDFSTQSFTAPIEFSGSLLVAVGSRVKSE
ncbi:hypothetical protein HYV70_00435 [Candidatus Uhrbacteria bacterium]|nr:hypothetical protein [Candidatus Uhrbacteria bacterium]